MLLPMQKKTLIPTTGEQMATLHNHRLGKEQQISKIGNWQLHGKKSLLLTS